MKLRASLSVIILLPITICCVLLAFSVLAITISVSRIELGEYNQDTVKLQSDSLRTEISDRALKIKNATEWFTSSARLIKAIKAESAEDISTLAKLALKSLDFDYFLVLDLQGKVIGNGISNHNNLEEHLKVDSIYKTETSLGALKGKIENGISKIGDSHICLESATPVIDTDGSIIGIALIGTELTTYYFAQSIKSLLNTEIIVYANDVSVASTILDNSGQPIINEPLENPEFLKDQISKNKGYGKNSIVNGKPFLGFYQNIIDSAGNIYGQYYLGRDISALDSIATHIMQTTGLIFIFVIIICLTILVIITRTFVVKPMRITSKALKEISEGDGDLTKRLSDKGAFEVSELSINYNTFVNGLSDTIKTVKNGLQDLRTISIDLKLEMSQSTDAIMSILKNVDEIREETLKQNSSVVESATTVEELAQTIQSLDHLIDSQGSNVTESSASIEEMIANINFVTKNIADLSIRVAGLVAASQDGVLKQQVVGDRIKKISDRSNALLEANAAILSIAEQTSILAMNAAIEAAHAGEYGKGFSVVADEIRKLSETASEQSKNIGDELEHVRSDIDAVVLASQDSDNAYAGIIQKVEEADNLVENARNAMVEQSEGSQQVLEGLSGIKDLTVEVRQASREMNSGNDILLKRVQALADITKVIKIAMTETSSQAENIQKVVSHVEDLVEKTSIQIHNVDENMSRFKV